MKRTTYLLKDSIGTVRARMTLPDEDSVSLEPWMVHNINQRGWRLEAWDASDSGIQIHGWADWQSVADSLANVLKIILEDGREPNEEADEQILAQAHSALVDYQVAQMEVAVAEPDKATEPKTEDDDGSQG